MSAEPPRLRARMVANTAPPPSNADASANNCEMLTNEPTTSSGDGMARACSVPARHSASATNIDMRTATAASATGRMQLRIRIYEFPQIGVANRPSEVPPRALGDEQREMNR